MGNCLILGLAIKKGEGEGQLEGEREGLWVMGNG